MRNMRITGIIVFSILLLACAGMDPDLKEIRLEVNLSSLTECIFITGMTGPENLFLTRDSLRIYATDLSGSVYIIDGEIREELQIIKSINVDVYGLGIDMDAGGNLYFAASGSDWQNTGGAVYRSDPELNNFTRITDYYPGLNGLCLDSDGNLYFASGTLSFFKQSGAVYIIRDAAKAAFPELLFESKSPNGMYYDGVLYFSETYRGVSAFNPLTGEKEFLCGKTRIVEGFDDLCKDSAGRLWIADPPNGFIKMYNPRLNTMVLFTIEGIGHASSCRTRMEEGREYLYITEIKQPGSKEYDGRGIISIPIDALLN